MDYKGPERRLRAELDKEIVKAALKEWLDDQFALFGRWTFAGLCATAFCGLVWLALKGWH